MGAGRICTLYQQAITTTGEGDDGVCVTTLSPLVKLVYVMLDIIIGFNLANLHTGTVYCLPFYELNRVLK